MTDANVFTLAQLVKSGKGDPSAVTDAIWDAGYRQPERTAVEAAQITIDTFFYCESLSMPPDIWPETYDHILQNELMKAVLGEDFELDDADPVTIAKNVIKAGFALNAESQNKEVVHGENG
ncbi:hypothetical protein [Serratia fonticola]|uniref:hypothetical protein n=1 Tax=Serratia fonticola TaxID=47917 RepID=UPI0027FF4127|nr:hypothetical protein [Serratia fonticola]MDQ7209434.1 hypothetical protein [Serratia fonticola]HBE9082243.1 hypothetical protein [Serratia fonticola]HBE9092733.1 hypothetical protein [Serratia fonticola]